MHSLYGKDINPGDVLLVAGEPRPITAITDYPPESRIFAPGEARIAQCGPSWSMTLVAWVRYDVAQVAA